MLKLAIQVVCDDCKEQFLFTRASAYATDALASNTNVLTAMLSNYHWRTCKTENKKFHYCPECCYEVDMEAEFAGQHPDHADSA